MSPPSSGSRFGRRCVNLRLRLKYEFPTLQLVHVYEVLPRKDQRGVDLISDALPFGRLWYTEPKAVRDAIGYAEHRSRSHDAAIRVYGEAGNARAQGRVQRSVTTQYCL